MGLAERRAIKAFQDQKYPSLESEIHSIAGFPVEFDIRWDTLSEENYAHLYDESFPKVYFKPIAEALRAIVVDELGKEALKEGLKKIAIRHTGSTDINFTGGILTVDHSPVSNVDYWNERKEQIQTALEKGL